MNRTKTTSTTRRRSLRHAALALCAVLVALVATSCTADALDGRDTPNAGNGTNPDDVLTFAVAPRPGFTEAAATRATDTKAAVIEQEIAGQARNDRESAPNSTVIPGLTRDLPNQSTAPATRATLTDNGTRWEQGDLLWLDVKFYQDKQDLNTFDTGYISALKYDANEWRYLTVAEAEELNAGNIPNFSRLMRWPRESENWADPGMTIVAYYAGSGKPDADGKLTIIPEGEIPTTPLIIGSTSGECGPDVQPVPLKFGYLYTSRIRIPAGYKVELTDTEYSLAIEFSPKGISREYKVIDQIPEQSEDTDVFLILWSNDATAKLTRDGVSHTFTFPTITDEYGNLTRNGASYTLTPYTSGTETPVADYDLTVATEAGLRAFAQAVNAGDRLPNGKPAAEARVLQTANIHLTQGEWVPIGTGDNRFRGAYNGNGNEISGLTITTAPQPDARIESYAGLFGRAEGAVLTGIRLRKVEINITESTSDATLYVGSIAGYIRYSTLSLCSADGTVKASSNGAIIGESSMQEVSAGGIAGESRYSTISRCRADVEIKAMTTTRGVIYAGGIAGKNVGCSFILSCEVQGKAVTAEEGFDIWAGGITGQNDGLIAFCRTGQNVVTAQNSDRSSLAGGLVGENSGILYSCYSRAMATATDRAGAIVGSKSPVLGREQHCYATGATDQGTSNLDAVPDNIVYDTDPDAGDIFRVMTGYTGKVESLTEVGTTYYPFTTTYDPSATPAYGIIPQRAVWTKDAWKDGGSDPKFPEINIEAYEGK